MTIFSTHTTNKVILLSIPVFIVLKSSWDEEAFELTDMEHFQNALYISLV